jgi:pyruvate dehydrogenase E2 component (dihydrolipoamide acetyltransferase)
MGMFARNRAAAASPLSPAGVPLTLPQRVAAKRLQESKQTIPHFYLQTSVNAAAMIARREEAKPVVKLAWDAFFVLAVAKAIARFERFRCRLDGERFLPAETDAVGVAVDVEGELYVIPIASPAAKTVEQISDEIRQTVQRLRDGDSEARRIRPALMTVTNLGVCNVESFIPIINPPEPAILGVGRVVPTPVARDDGRISVEHRCTLTLCVDHRVVNGRCAGDFLTAIVNELESFGKHKP